MSVKLLPQRCESIEYASYSIYELINILFLEKNIEQSILEKIVYRLNNNFVCDSAYLNYMLGLDELMVKKFLALIEIIKRKETISNALEYIRSPKDFAQCLTKYCQYLPHETVFLGLLNHKNALFELKHFTQDQVGGVKIDMKLLMKHVLCENAARIIIGHNHPSGDPRPSTQDKVLTQHIERLLKYFDLELLDHIIIGRKSYYSFKNKRILNL
ncbi:MAG TPA: JAB domain-containing protein [Oligoflexia bacterium]|nr:JAB domain-containing protein [Oligoflexia bacterium]HMR23716.1 JAB domain-containing protein [Oligoflexia bacterium]